MLLIYQDTTRSNDNTMLTRLAINNMTDNIYNEGNIYTLLSDDRRLTSYQAMGYYTWLYPTSYTCHDTTLKSCQTTLCAGFGCLLSGFYDLAIWIYADCNDILEILKFQFCNLAMGFLNYEK